MRDGMTRRRELDLPDAPKHSDGWSATLVEVVGSAEGNEYLIDQQRIVMGRGPDVDIAFKDDEMSSSHAAFEHIRGGLVVTDLDSTNGTRVNGDDVTSSRVLAHGDQIEIGSHTFHLLLEKREKPPPTWVVDG